MLVDFSQLNPSYEKFKYTNHIYLCYPFGFVKLHINQLLMQFILHYENFHVNYLYVDCIIESSLSFHHLYNFRNLQPKLNEETQKLI
jgi:hypothetical protein